MQTNLQWTTLLLFITTSVMFTTTAAQGTGALPEATISPASQAIRSGAAATFTCNISPPGTSVLSVTWLHNGTSLPPTDARFSTSNLELTISNLSEDLAGNYTCVVANSVGIVSSSVAELQIAFYEVNVFSSDEDAPYEINVTAGQPTAIDCVTYTSNALVRLMWNVIDSGVRHQISDFDRATAGQNGSLYLLNPMLRDDGNVYTCNVFIQEFNIVLNGYVKILVQESTLPTIEPFMVVTPQNVTTWVGQTAYFECIPGGRNAIMKHAMWAARVGRTTPDTYRLTVGNVIPSHAGVFTCTIDGIGSFSATLSLIDPPIFDIPLPSVPLSLTYGEPLSLNCASETTDYEWFHNGRKLAAVTGTSLSVERTTMSDAGTYQCFVHNQAGYSQTATIVQVATIGAEITTDLPARQVAYRGQPFIMTCAAFGAPPPSYTWFKSSIPLETSTAFNVSVSAGEGVLLVQNVDHSSEGQYQCSAQNALPNGTVVGSDTTTTTLRTIEPTTITQQLGTLFSVQVATHTTLFCEVSRDVGASVEFAWMKNGEPLQTSSRMQFLDRENNGNLQIYPVKFDDMGVYQCIVSTTHDGLVAPEVRSNMVTLDITATPVAPIILSLNGTSPTSFNIQWAFSGTPTFIRSYTIEVQTPPNSDTSPWMPLHSKSSSAVTAADVSSNTLEAFTLYGVRVVAVYMDGERVNSEVGVVLTGTDVPADAPREVTGGAVNDTTVELSWKPPAIPRGEIVSYTVRYRMEGEGDDQFVPETAQGNSTSHVIRDLQSFKIFEVQVAASTSAGMGKFSPPVLVETGSFREPRSGGFVSSIGFIVLVAVLFLLLVVCFVVTICVARHKCSKGKAEGRYHIRNSGYFGKGVNIMGADAPDAGRLSEEAMASYGGARQRAFSSTSPVGSRADPIEIINLEGGSLFGGTVTTGTPQLTGGGRPYQGVSNGMVVQAPNYIDPPGFEETVMMRSRTYSAASSMYGGSNDVNRPVREWDVLDDNNGSGTNVFSPSSFSAPVRAFSNATPAEEFAYDDSDNSIEKSPMDLTSEADTDLESEHTHYSHLAGAVIDKRGTMGVGKTSLQGSKGGPPATFHHQLKLPLSTCSSGGTPVTVGQIVDQRLLRAPSEDVPISPISNATYV